MHWPPENELRFALQNRYKAGTGEYGPQGSGVGTCYDYPTAFNPSKLAFKDLGTIGDAGLVAAIKIAPLDVRPALSLSRQS